jgi:hypothetical protein
MLPSRCVREATAASTACSGAGAAVSVKAVAKRDRCWLPDPELFTGEIQENLLEIHGFYHPNSTSSRIRTNSPRPTTSPKGWGVIPHQICTKKTFWPCNLTMKKTRFSSKLT